MVGHQDNYQHAGSVQRASLPAMIERLKCTPRTDGPSHNSHTDFAADLKSKILDRASSFYNTHKIELCCLGPPSATDLRLGEPVQSLSGVLGGKNDLYHAAKANGASPMPVLHRILWRPLNSSRDCMVISRMTETCKFLPYFLPVLKHAEDIERKCSAAGGGKPTPCIVILTKSAPRSVKLEQEFENYSGITKIRSMYMNDDPNIPDSLNTKLVRKEKIRILISTPGCLARLTRKAIINLQPVSMLLTFFSVLDESHELTDDEHNLVDIIGAMPPERTIVAISSIISPFIERIFRQYMRNPFVILMDTPRPQGLNCVYPQEAFVDSFDNVCAVMEKCSVASDEISDLESVAADSITERVRLSGVRPLFEFFERGHDRVDRLKDYVLELKSKFGEEFALLIQTSSDIQAQQLHGRFKFYDIHMCLRYKNGPDIPDSFLQEKNPKLICSVKNFRFPNDAVKQIHVVHYDFPHHWDDLITRIGKFDNKDWFSSFYASSLTLLTMFAPRYSGNNIMRIMEASNQVVPDFVKNLAATQMSRLLLP